MLFQGTVWRYQDVFTRNGDTQKTTMNLKRQFIPNLMVNVQNILLTKLPNFGIINFIKGEFSMF